MLYLQTSSGYYCDLRVPPKVQGFPALAECGPRELKVLCGNMCDFGVCEVSPSAQAAGEAIWHAHIQAPLPSAAPPPFLSAP